MAESKEELKNLLMRVKEESEKAGLNLRIKTNKQTKKLRQGSQSHHFMANRRGKSGSSDRFPFLGSEIAVDGDCSHEIRRHLLLRRKAMTNFNSILKNKDITLLTKLLSFQ